MRQGWLEAFRDAWRKPAGREGRNEQRKLRAAVANAVSIALVVAAIVGPYINPDLAQALTWQTRLTMFAVGGVFHLFAARLVRDIEDK